MNKIHIIYESRVSMPADVIVRSFAVLRRHLRWAVRTIPGAKIIVPAKDSLLHEDRGRRTVACHATLEIPLEALHLVVIGADASKVLTGWTAIYKPSIYGEAFTHSVPVRGQRVQFDFANIPAYTREWEAGAPVHIVPFPQSSWGKMTIFDPETVATVEDGK